MQYTTNYTTTSMHSFGIFIAFLTIVLIAGCEEDPYYFTYDYSDAPSFPNVSEAIEIINYDDGLVVYIIDAEI